MIYFTIAGSFLSLLSNVFSENESKLSEWNSWASNENNIRKVADGLLSDGEQGMAVLLHRNRNRLKPDIPVVVQVTGNALTYLWQYSQDGGETWIDTTRTRDNFGTIATTAMNGRMYRCLVTDGKGNTVVSDAATLTVEPAIEIISQTDAQTVNVGELYRFRVAAVSNTGSKLTYLWQYSKTLKGWTDTTRTVNNYGTYATVGVDGKYFRCKITDEAGNVVYSTPAMVRVLSNITITAQPEDTTVASGKRFYFTVAATGSSLTYLWQYSTDGGQTWIDTTRARNNYTTYAKKGMNGRMFRCVITDSSNNSVISEAGTLTVK